MTEPSRHPSAPGGLDWEPGRATVTPLRAPLVDEEEVAAPSRVAMILAAVVVAAAGVALVLDGSGSAPPAPQVPDPAPLAPALPPPPPPVPAVAEPDAATPPTWPAPPNDHDPIVSGRPEVGPPLLGTATDLTVVYVNTIGRPTVVDLDTGSRWEVKIAPTRAVDVFSVERGAIVGQPGSRTLAEGTDRAVVFRVYQSIEVATGASSSPPPLGPDLCLDVDACAALTWRAGDFVRGRDTVVRLALGGPAEVDEFLDPSRWSVDGRWWDADGVRIPAPGPGDIWVVHQPGG